MDQLTRRGSGHLTTKEMFETLLQEITTLRRQSDNQQRQLEHLQRTTSLLLERNKASLQHSGNFRFNHLPLEIREMIWELAIPCRLLAYPGMELDVLDNDGVSLSLSVPAIANVCRESRRVFAARHQFGNLSGSCLYPGRPPHLWRLKHDYLARWTSFRPRTDALLIDPCDFLPSESQKNYPLPQLAEHIVVSSFTNWRTFLDDGFNDGDERIVTGWVQELAEMLPKFYPSVKAPISTRAPICNLRTIDFAVNSVTEVDRNFPPNLVHRLFGGDSVKIVDLSNEEATDTILRIIEDEMYPILDPTYESPLFADLRHSCGIFEETADDIFSLIKPSLLKTLVVSYYEASVSKDSASRRTSACLLSPLKDGELDMDVTWVKDLCERIDVRPVHVFVRTERMLQVSW